MTPAELKTTREALCLTVTWLAEQAGVQERTVRHWESGRNQVPADVAALVGRIDADINEAVRQACDIVAAADLPVSTVTLIRYKTDSDLWDHRSDMHGLPATTHGSMLYRLRRALSGIGVESRIVYMDSESYRAWLAGRPNTESMRAAWAAEQEG